MCAPAKVSVHSYFIFKLTSAYLIFNFQRLRLRFSVSIQLPRKRPSTPVEDSIHSHIYARLSPCLAYIELAWSLIELSRADVVEVKRNFRKLNGSRIEVEVDLHGSILTIRVHIRVDGTVVLHDCR